MGYIIGLLIEHDQFESLVNKGVEKVMSLGGGGGSTPITALYVGRATACGTD